MMFVRTLALALPLALCVAGLAAAQDEEPKLGWSDSAELSWVSTSGNSESTTIGFKNTTERRWESAALIIRLGGIRAESDTITRFAVGDPNSFDPQESSTSELTAENYYFNGRYGRDITTNFFWYVGLGWERNRPAGIDNRYVAEGGVGNTWNDTEDLKFRTAYALTWTKQEDQVVVAGVDDSWIGARFSWNYLNKFGKVTTYENLFILDADLEEASNWRGNMINSVAVSMSERLALKVSLQWLYQNDPALQEVDLFAPGDLVNPIGRVAVPVENLDSIFTASLVVNF